MQMDDPEEARRRTRATTFCIVFAAMGVNLETANFFRGTSRRTVRSRRWSCS